MTATNGQKARHRNTSGLVPFQNGHPPLNLDARKSPLSQASEIQRILFKDIQAKETKPIVRSALARAWCIIQECKYRVIMGVPAPGQLRPDLDPVQLAKALKRSRSRKPLDIASSINGAASSSASMVDDEPAAGPAEPENQAQPPTPPTPDRAYVPSPIPEKGKTQKPTGETLAGEGKSKKESL